MRVVVTGLRGIPDIMGGVETHCEELLPRIAALDSAVQIIVAGRSAYLANADSKHSTYRGVAIRAVLSMRGRSSEAITGTISGVIYARAKNADILHIHAIGPALLTPLSRLLGMRTVITHHGTDYDRAKWGMAGRAALRVGEIIALRFANDIIAISPSLAAQLKTRFPGAAHRIHYIPNGAPEMGLLEQEPHETLASFGLEAGKYILTVGRLVPEKGADYLIRAYRASNTDRKLVIVGAADHDSDYSARLLAEGSEAVVFPGQQSRAVLRQLYENAALFVLPSFHEGLPISALEAGRCGCPMVLSDIQANRDIGLPEKHYFPVGDEDALRACLAAEPTHFAIDKDEMSARFDWDRSAQATLAVYRRTQPPEASS